jgi:uncharacterized LabA/DUF88 family protein
LSSTERVGIFIDGNSLYAAASSLGFDVDYRRLLQFYRRSGKLVCARYFTSMDGEDVCSPVGPLIDWLADNGFSIVSKPDNDEIAASGPRPRTSMAIEMTVDALRLAGGLDHLVLFWDAADVAAVVRALQDMGKRVSVISTSHSASAAGPRLPADGVFQLAELKAMIAKELFARPRNPGTCSPV